MTKPSKPTQSRKPAGKPKTETRPAPETAAGAGDLAPSATSSHSPAGKSKVARVIALLQRQQGATLDELVTETGWQPHTTRSALTGLRKKGYVINSDKVDDVRRYRTASAK